MGRKNRKKAGRALTGLANRAAAALDGFRDTCDKLRAIPIAMLCLFVSEGKLMTRLETNLPKEDLPLLAEELKRAAEEVLKSIPSTADASASASEGQPQPAAATT